MEKEGEIRERKIIEREELIVEGREGKESKREEEKVEICLVEEGEGKKEQLILPVWEDDIKDHRGRRVFSIPRKEMTREEEGGQKTKRDQHRHEKACGLLEDFPNLKVGGLLRDPELKKDKGSVTEISNQTASILQSTTAGGRPSQTYLLRDDCHECIRRPGTRRVN